MKIPDKLENKSITKIGKNAFQDCKKLSEMYMNFNLTAADAFKNCTSLETVEFSGKEINLDAFTGCTSLKTLQMPYVNKITGNATNINSSNLTFDVVNNSYALKYCTDNKLKYTAVGTLDSKTGLFYEVNNNKITITGIKNDVTKVDVPSTIDGKTVTNIKSLANLMTSVKEVSLPNTIETIEKGAFQDAQSLEKITLSNNLKTIDEYAFNLCSNLKTIILPSSLTSIGKAAFRQSGLTEITIPCSLNANTGTNNSEAIFGECTNLKIVIFNGNVKEVNINHFNKCSKLKTVFIPNSITSITGDVSNIAKTPETNVFISIIL